MTAGSSGAVPTSGQGAKVLPRRGGEAVLPRANPHDALLSRGGAGLADLLPG